MNKSFLFLIFVLLSSLMVSAEVGFVNETFELWADISESGTPYGATAANITIYNPQNETFIDNVEMLPVAIGIFKYNFTPNETGNWYANAQFYNNSVPVGFGSQSFAIEKSTILAIFRENMSLGIIIGLLAIIAVLIYFGHKNTKSFTGSWEIKRLVGWLMYAFSGLVFLILTFIMMAFAEGEVYYPIMKAVFILVQIVVGLVCGIGAVGISIILMYIGFLAIWKKVVSG